MPTTAMHLWRPSAARTITLDAFVPVPRGTLATVPADLSWPLKDPADLLDYQFDIAPALAGNEGDAISTLDIAISPSAPGDLSLGSAAADGSRAILWLGGGVAGTTYTVTLTLGTQSGRVLARTVLLPVAALATPGVPIAGLLTDTGSLLTDQNGNPILTNS